MKKSALPILATLTCLAATSLAQPPLQNKTAKIPAYASPEWQREVHNRVLATITLTPAQKKAIIAAHNRFTSAQVKADQTHRYKAPDDPNYEKRKAAHDKANAAFHAEAKKILGAKYEPYCQGMEREHLNLMKKAGITGPTWAQKEKAIQTARDRVAKKLGITAAQQKSILAIDEKAARLKADASNQLDGKVHIWGDQEERDAIAAAYQQIESDRHAALVKLLGEKRAIAYEKSIVLETQKERSNLWINIKPNPPKKTATKV